MIGESHKDIVFREREIHLKQTKTVVFNASDISIDLIEAISDNLFKENIISVCPEGTLRDIKLLTNTWQDLSKKRVENIQISPR